MGKEHESSSKRPEGRSKQHGASRITKHEMLEAHAVTGSLGFGYGGYLVRTSSKYRRTSCRCRGEAWSGLAYRMTFSPSATKDMTGLLLLGDWRDGFCHARAPRRFHTGNKPRDHSWQQWDCSCESPLYSGHPSTLVSDDGQSDINHAQSIIIPTILTISSSKLIRYQLSPWKRRK